MSSIMIIILLYKNKIKKQQQQEQFKRIFTRIRGELFRKLYLRLDELKWVTLTLFCIIIITIFEIYIFL
jgi:hypothetical protein